MPRKIDEFKLSSKKLWEDKFLLRIEGIHKRNKLKVVQKILKRIDTQRNSLINRSRKYEVECNITIEELREMVHAAYGTKCRYCDKILTINNLVFDHRIPISKGGNSNKENLQIICKTSNSMKGSLVDEEFKILLDWLQTVSPNLRDDIRIRLARGIH